MTAIYNWLVDFYNWIKQLAIDVTQWVIDLINWLIDYLGYLAYSIFESIILALSGLITSIPRPSVFETAQTEFCSNLSGAGWALGQVDLGSPLAIIFSGYAVRFLIRRLPVIG